MKVVNKLLKSNIFKHLVIIGGVFFSFLILDVYLRYFSNQSMLFYGWARSAPNLLTFSWIILLIGILYLLPKKAKIITYAVSIILSNILVYAEFLHYRVLDRFFMFSDLFLVGEGKSYFLFAIGKTTYQIVIVLLVSLITAIITIFLMKKADEPKKSKKYVIILVLTTIFLVASCRFVAISKYGKQAPATSWEAAYSSKNIYLDYNNQNKCMQISGVYELVFRSTYLYLKDNFFSNKKEMANEVAAFLEMESSNENEVNEYTGIFKGKNVIYILMESIDSWLVTEDVMPTLYKLSQEGLNFTNRYAPTFGGGQTINSEFAMNTGLYAISNNKAIYNYDKNSYPYSLANMLKNNNYSAVSVHTNVGNFYNRTNLHRALGYDKHYGLSDMKDIDHTNYNYYNDSSLVKNDEVYNLIVREEPFLSFVISYSAHIPYDESNDRCITNPYGLNVDGNKELSCIRNLAKETDEMLRILIEKLKADNKLDDTILVLATDHYAYGYSDQDYIKQYKNVNNSNLLQKVPLVIWSNKVSHKDIDTLMDTADILPTLLNMLGISYNPNYYVGTDVFSSNHENYVYFANDSFYDGNIYYDGYNISENNEYIGNMTTTIRQKIELNNKIILSDYFSTNK